MVVFELKMELIPNQTEIPLDKSEGPEISPDNNNKQHVVKYFYCLVNNIPPNFHASELRNYFSAFTEEGKFDCFHFRHRPQFICNPNDNDDNNPELEPVPSSSSSSQTNNGVKSKINADSKKLCSLVRFTKEYHLVSFIKRYSGKYWMDKQGRDLNSKCLITRVKIDPKDESRFSKELHPPRFMPCGNVGTTNSHFLQLIKDCRLPPSLIKKLDLEFPVGRSYKKFSKVPYDYKTQTVKVWETPEEEQEVLTAKGHSISDVYLQPTSPSTRNDEDNEQNNSDNDSGPDDDDDRCEGWEHHEATADDPSYDQDRIKERLYEEEIELQWEKGGPGIVWYTDAQFWDEKKGNFDERTSDNLDVDMDIYYSPDGGDKDARDLLDIRQGERFHKGLDSDFSVFKKPPQPKTSGRKSPSTSLIASETNDNFEKFTPGVARKVMEKCGWRDGKGLGKSQKGITEAIPSEGQTGQDKRGLGYYGEKLEYSSRKKQRTPYPQDEDYDDVHRISIGTIYDNPEKLDTEEPLLRSNAISFIKRY